MRLINLLIVGKNGQRASRNEDVCVKRGGSEEMEQKMKAFVALMLNELENTIELLRLWKSLWGHRKLAPVWELARRQKRGFVWGRFLQRLAAAQIHGREAALSALPPLVSGTYFWLCFRCLFSFLAAALTFLGLPADTMKSPPPVGLEPEPAGSTGTQEEKGAHTQF